MTRHRSAARPALPRLEQLEDRTVPSTVTVNAGQAVRTVNAQVLGVNLAWWDSALNTAQTQQMVQAAGLNFFRLPGGSSSDTWHFNVGPTYNGEGTTPSMASFIAAVGGTGLVTLNYGTASPQEGAALLAYLNGSTTNTTAIGVGPQWSDSSNSWVNVDWKTAGYWAGLRAATPLATDDGLNFLRLGRSAPFGIKYFEVGNEIYGNWETDHHATPHDPATYVAFAKQFAAYAAQIAPSIGIGVDGSGTGGSYSQIAGNWTDQVLQQCAAQGFTPNFVSDHNYMFDPGNENDANLLLHSATDPNATGYGGPINWAGRAAAYRNLIAKDLGAAGAGVQLLATEFNSVSYNPSNQTTSLVNGLWLADALGGLLQTEYNGGSFWDLRNGYDTSHYNGNLYGWRTGGDYGLLGSGSGQAPATGTYVPYPTYFAEQLLSKMVHTGDTVVQATTDDPTLTAYAVKQQNGHLDLLVINKNVSTNLTGQFNVAGFTPASQATVWQYGKAQDTAQSQTTDGHAALANFSQTLSSSGSGFTFLAPAYSMTVLDLAPAPGVIDNGQAGFSETGTGWTHYTGAGYNNNLDYAAAGTGANTATWQFTNLSAGSYDAQVTWNVVANHASNATYSVYDGNTLLGNVTVNQQQAPSGATVNGVPFQSLGHFQINSGTLKIVLTDNANGYVIADAAHVAAVAAAPQVQVTAGSQVVAYNGSFSMSALVGQTATQTFTVTNTGGATLTLSDPITLPSGFTLSSDFGSTSLAPGQSTTFAVQLNTSAAASYSGSVSFGTNVSGANPFSFTLSGTVAATTVIDNGQAGFSESGSGWTHYTGAGYGNNLDYAAAGSGANTATWQMTGLAAGTYDAQVTWTAVANHATNATYQVYDGNTLLGTVTVNQQQAPSGTTVNGSAFQSLGQYKISSGTLKVVLTDNANGYVIADAFRAAVATGVIIDNGQAGFSETGTGWTHYTGTGYNNTVDYAAAGTGANTATWQLAGLASASYDVQMTWNVVSNHASNATYSVYDGSTMLGTATVNQQQAPSGTTVNGSAFQSLGHFQINSGTLKVVLTDNANGYVIADALRVV